MKSIRAMCKAHSTSAHSHIEVWGVEIGLIRLAEWGKSDFYPLSWSLSISSSKKCDRLLMLSYITVCLFIYFLAQSALFPWYNSHPPVFIETVSTVLAYTEVVLYLCGSLLLSSQEDTDTRSSAYRYLHGHRAGSTWLKPKKPTWISFSFIHPSLTEM